ncbi:MAG: V-type ATP synthase subunit D [Lachnospiraceae bacterium]|uniref:V-type ATP synthase subunit D n=1 Tax=Candidatus Weimeria bifida TaxID=2599074 RepID=A0A6N7IYJ7_9FIRM|nr:V-type ATP synthase subunit D [Candidatus Weimeria bifida]RRF97261.1 MAG: V-type ATP synthase subunit D [Lachnospiraceae bacterium]
MAASNVNPTRMELTRQKKKLQTALKGHKLLKDKRDELMRRFLDLVRQDKVLREEVEAEIKEANKSFVLAGSQMSKEAVSVAFMAPKQEASVDVSTRNVMSVEIPVFDTHFRGSDKSDFYPYGYAFTSADLDEGVGRLSKLLPKLLKLAESEKSCQLMAAEIEKTRRRVNALEHVLIPQTEENIRYITMKLDENERSSQVRLMKVKDMMLEDAHHYKERRDAEPLKEDVS